MTDDGSEARTVRGALCAKCEHLNPADVTRCERCDSHLYVVCHHCSQRNLRVHTRCVGCHRRMHRSILGKLSRILGQGRTSITRWQLVFLVLGILAGFGLIVFLAEVSLRPMH